LESSPNRSVQAVGFGVPRGRPLDPAALDGRATVFMTVRRRLVPRPTRSDHKVLALQIEV
jgi:hypothetical protein